MARAVFNRLGMALALTALGCAALEAQQRNNHWLFRKAHLQFSGGAPANVESAVVGVAAAALSDTMGALKVYVSAFPHGVRDASHNLLPGQPANMAQLSFLSSRSVFIPRPGHPDECYLAFVRGESNGAVSLPQLKLLRIELGPPGAPAVQADAQWVDVQDDSTLCIMAVPHANGSDYWLVAPTMTSNGYRAYRIGPAGLDPVPVLSQAGQQRPPGWQWGVLAPSVQGHRFAAAFRGASPTELDTLRAELFAFDAASGVVTHVATLPSRRAEGLEFSPSGRWLYVDEEDWQFAAAFVGRTLVSYDLLAADIGASRTVVHSYQSQGVTAPLPGQALSLGPDGRIYRAGESPNSLALGVIHQPDLPPAQCAYEHDGFTCLQPTYTLPAPLKRYHDDSGLPTVTPSPQPAVRAAILPNPVRGRGILRHEGLAGPVRLRWLDAAGRAVRLVAGAASEGALAFDASPLPPGMYLLEVLAADGSRRCAARVMVEE